MAKEIEGEVNILVLRSAVLLFFLCSLSACLSSVLLAGCVVKDPVLNADGSLGSEKKVSLVSRFPLKVEDIEAIAAMADKNVMDGWIAGRDPRILKSPYRGLPASAKAEFAMAYAGWLDKSAQNLALSKASYVPYRKRARFAREYWEGSPYKEQFEKETEKYQIVWIHDSLLDGSELYFRALESKYASSLDSTITMAHDLEQNMVTKYMEDESTESTFSQQFKPKDAKSDEAKSEDASTKEAKFEHANSDGKIETGSRERQELTK